MGETFKQLATVRVVDATPTVLYTVPALTSAIVKSMHLVNVSGAQNALQMWQGGSGNGQLILNPTTVEAGGYGTWDGAITMAAGDTLVAQGSSAAGATITVEGVEIT